MCHLVRQDNSAVKFDRVEIAFILALSYCLNLLIDELGGKPEHAEKAPDYELKKMAETAPMVRMSMVAVLSLCRYSCYL